MQKSNRETLWETLAITHTPSMSTRDNIIVRVCRRIRSTKIKWSYSLLSQEMLKPTNMVSDAKSTQTISPQHIDNGRQHIPMSCRFFLNLCAQIWAHPFIFLFHPKKDNYIQHMVCTNNSVSTTFVVRGVGDHSMMNKTDASAPLRTLCAMLLSFLCFMQIKESAWRTCLSGNDQAIQPASQPEQPHHQPRFALIICNLCALSASLLYISTWPSSSI